MNDSERPPLRVVDNPPDDEQNDDQTVKAIKPELVGQTFDPLETAVQKLADGHDLSAAAIALIDIARSLRRLVIESSLP